MKRNLTMTRYRYCPELLGNYSEPVNGTEVGNLFIHKGLTSYLQVVDSDLLLRITSRLPQIASYGQSAGFSIDANKVFS